MSRRRETKERAIMHFCLRNGMWNKTNVDVIVDEQPFSEGSFRHAFHARMYDNNGRMRNYVCKFAKDPNTSKDLYFNDIKAQVFALIWAQKFNNFHPPKPVSYVECFVLELVERRGRPLCGCEELIEGDFKKHNNNVGAVSNWVPETKEQKLDNQMAQAFSHFTYEHSKCQILICDIQGVGACYTDPQVHTLSGKGFGGGNLGTTGIKAFLLRHRCNEMCGLMQLPVIEAKNLSENLKQLDTTTAFPFAEELEAFQDDTKRLYVKSGGKMTIGRPVGEKSEPTSEKKSAKATPSQERRKLGQSESVSTMLTEGNASPPRSTAETAGPARTPLDRRRPGDTPSLRSSATAGSDERSDRSALMRAQTDARPHRSARVSPKHNAPEDDEGNDQTVSFDADEEEMMKMILSRGLEA